MKPMAGSEPVREPELGPESGEEQRRHIRKRVLWAAQLETGGTSCECFILNVSRSGAKLRLAAPMIIAPHQPVTLAMAQYGTLHGEAVWQRANKVGIRFNADPEQVAKILGQALTL
jgi:hypothetical protein